MEDQATCGRGLAERSRLHSALAELLASVGLNLELHMTTLNLGAEVSRPEYEAYLLLSEQHRRLAADLRAIAVQMAQYRDLPMAEHDSQALVDPRLLEAFRDLVRREEDLLALLKNTIAADRVMLEHST